MSDSCTGFVRRNARSLSSPRTCVTIVWPGLKPSFRFHAAGLMWLPSLSAGIAFRWIAIRPSLRK
jgi:hypothetical protein